MWEKVSFLERWCPHLEGVLIEWFKHCDVCMCVFLCVYNAEDEEEEGEIEQKKPATAVNVGRRWRKRNNGDTKAPVMQPISSSVSANFIDNLFIIEKLFWCDFISFDEQGVAENIQEFDSCSSDEGSPLEPPHLLSTLHTSTPVTTVTSPPHTSTPAPHHTLTRHQQHSMTLRDFCSHLTTADLHMATPTPDYQSIVTPPSSPEATPPSKRSEVKLTTASEWVKQITLESDDLGVTSGASLDKTMLGLNDTVMRGVCDGGEGVRRGGRRGRVVAGGLAAALDMVEQRERSDITFWEHRARHMDNSNTGIHTFVLLSNVVVLLILDTYVWLVTVPVRLLFFCRSVCLYDSRGVYCDHQPLSHTRQLQKYRHSTSSRERGRRRRRRRRRRSERGDGYCFILGKMCQVSRS